MKNSATNSPLTIDVRLNNRTALFGTMDGNVYQRLRKFWSFTPPGVWFMPQFKPTRMLRGQRDATVKKIDALKADPAKNALRIEHLEEIVAAVDKRLASMWDGTICLLKAGVLPAGLFRATRLEAMEEMGIHFNVRRERRSITFGKGLPDSGERYEHQNRAVAAMMNATHKGGGIILSATGTGKTKIAAAYFSKVDCDCLFIVDQLDLLYQQQKELEGWLGEKVGAVGDSRFEPMRVTVATVQTLSIHRKKPEFRRWFSGVNAMIVDELHEAMAKRNFDVLRSVNPIAIFGLTATLQMGRKETRYKAFSFAGPVIFEFPIVKGIKRKVLSPVKALQLLFPEEIFMGSVSTMFEREDYLQMQVLENREKLEACEAIATMLRRINRRIVILAERRQHVASLTKMFPDGTYGLAHGDIKTDDRKKAIDDFEEGRTRLLIASRVFKKGVNIKRIDAMIDMAEMTSKNDALQKLGRSVRLHKDKTDAWYFDFGTQGTGRFGRAARSRKGALKKAGIEVKTVKVQSAEQAIAAVKKFIKKESKK